MNNDNEDMLMGITCIECHTVIFSVNKLIEHKKECNCRYFKQGKGDLVLFIRLLQEEDKR